MKIKRIVVHCSDSPHRRDKAETIHAWHLTRGWSGIGYHWVIQEDGTVEAGRPEYWTGAHVKNYNTGSIGICLFGVSYFTEDQFESLDLLIRQILERHSEVEDICGHCDLDQNKTCPNFDVKKWLKKRGINY